MTYRFRKTILLNKFGLNKKSLPSIFKNVLINKYNVHIAVIAEESATVVDQSKIDALNSQMESEQAKYDALLIELESLQS